MLFIICALCPTKSPLQYLNPVAFKFDIYMGVSES